MDLQNVTIVFNNIFWSKLIQNTPISKINHKIKFLVFAHAKILTLGSSALVCLISKRLHILLFITTITIYVSIMTNFVLPAYFEMYVFRHPVQLLLIYVLFFIFIKWIYMHKVKSLIRVIHESWNRKVTIPHGLS